MRFKVLGTLWLLMGGASVWPRPPLGFAVLSGGWLIIGESLNRWSTAVRIGRLTSFELLLSIVFTSILLVLANGLALLLRWRVARPLTILISFMLLVDFGGLLGAMIWAGFSPTEFSYVFALIALAFALLAFYGVWIMLSRSGRSAFETYMARPARAANGA